jgi:adenylosuccinate lyase
MSITSLSPLDGRYESKVAELQQYFSEYALIKYRIIVEISFFMALSSEKEIKEVDPFSNQELSFLSNILHDFNEQEAQKVKDIEQITNHDVKAVEYYLKEKLRQTSLKKYLEFIHFACTSEDINNLAYALMIKDALRNIYLPQINILSTEINKLAKKWKNIPMLSRTHGQPASPTTVGKEFKIFAERLLRQINFLNKQEILGKLNGATGNFNAHYVAYPKLNWFKFSEKFIKKLGLTPNLCTSQIEPHDFMAEIFDNIRRINTIILDFDRDLWMYISYNVFIQKLKEGEVGSSTMPHKVNPIDFENSEGNIGIANAFLNHFADKLPVSRMQRDLTDSTVQRNIGVALGYSILAYKSTTKGLSKLELNKKVIHDELDQNWEVLGEAIQTVMRKYKVDKPYERLKQLTRGKKIKANEIKEFLNDLPIPEEEKNQLRKLTPQTYIGGANKW